MKEGIQDIFAEVVKWEQISKDFGFYWTDFSSSLDQVVSECAEVREAYYAEDLRSHLQEEMGDLIHATLSLCFYLGFDPKKTLEVATLKFIKRFQVLRQVAEREGRQTLQGLPHEELMRLWKEAKKETS